MLHQYTSGASAINPILVEESSEGSSTSDEHPDSEMADSDDLDDGMEDVYEDEEDEEDEEDWSGGESWDPMAFAIAGMKMTDPFAGYTRQRAAPVVPMGMDSVDPLHG